MRILFTIAHFFKASNDEARHGSQRKDPQPRLQALTESITALHQLFGQSQRIINIERRVALLANQPQAHQLDIVICTTQNHHLLDRLPLPANLYRHHPTNAEPMLLGFECQSVLQSHLGQYDYYCFLEDDLIIHDPWFFIKLNWFTQQTSDLNLLQPNRYEISTYNAVHKAYIDGDLAMRVTAPFQNVQTEPELSGTILNTAITCRRALNPHSGCYFLNQNQMKKWASQSYFQDKEIDFVGSLESAATLGIMKTFQIYKPAPANANFLEIQHSGTGFLGLIGKEVPLSLL